MNPAIDFDQPQFRAIWQSELEDHYSEIPFSELGPN
jgi:hypothetical protein